MVSNFPFKPYPQQEDLMNALYECIESSSVGCFESPTGTGKSYVHMLYNIMYIVYI